MQRDFETHDAVDFAYDIPSVSRFASTSCVI